MNSLKKRALAILLSAVTLASSMMSATSVFADELSKENGTIYADIKGVGGTVSIEESENKTSYYLDDSDEVKSRDSNNSETVAVSDNDNYNVQYDSEVGTTLTIKVIPDVGYKVSEYSTAIDGGDAQSSLTEDTVEYSSQVTVSGTNQYISVNFEEVKLDDNAVYSLPDVDFSSCRLLVGSENEELFTNCSNVLSSYEGVHLLQFESEEATKKAYISLLDRVDFVNVDTNDFSVADIENVESDAMSEEINPINELAKTEIEEVKESNVIAVIDTGSSERANVIERVSVLGDNVEDDNGHGDKMISKILSQDENAKIISIKAMDSNGKGTTSSVYAGLKYAIEKKVDIINMSFVGIANEDNTCIEELVKEAIKQGITVVGSAGNNGVDASEYIPGCIEEAYIIGAANADGERLDNSNYGDTVDYNVVANSTSEAAALFTGYLSKNNKAIDGVNSNGLIYSTEYTMKSDDNPKEDVKPTNPKDDNESDVDTSKSVIVKYLFIDDSNLTGEETIDTIMATDHSKVLYQLQGFVDVIKDKDGTYNVTTDAPFVNGSSTSKKPLDVAFAKGNDTGMEVTKGVSYNFDTNVATISEDALIKGDGDFCNLQIQLLVPSSLSKKAKVNALVEDETGKKLGVTTINGTPYDESYVKIVTKDALSKKDIKVIANGSSTNSDKYEFEDSYVKLGCLGIYKDVKIIVSGSRESAFEISKYNGPNAKKVAWLKDNTDISKLKVGNSASIKVRLAHRSLLGTVDSKPIVDDSIPNYGSIGGGTWEFGDLAGIALPTKIKFNSNCNLDFQFYSNGVDSYGNWGNGYNHTIMGACYHVTKNYSVEEYKNATIKIISISEDTENTNRTYITFSVLTNDGLCGGDYPQSVGGIYYVGVEKTAIKLQMQKDSSVSGFNSAYNRAGAKYYIYKDYSCKTPLKYKGNNAYIEIGEDGYGKLGTGNGTNNASGDKNTRFWGKDSGADIPVGTYYAIEKDAPTSGQFTCGSKFQTNLYKFVNTGKVDSKNVPIYRAHYFVDGKDVGTPEDDPLIYLQLKKFSANPEITNGNTCYSYKGAVYGIYWKESDAEKGINKRGDIVTDEDGYGTYGQNSNGDKNSNDTNLVYKNKNSGTAVRAAQRKNSSEFDGWFVKELVAPKGYELDDTVYQLTDCGTRSKNGLKIYRPNGSSKGVTDKPGDDPVRLVLRKKDPYTGEIIPLSGAVFKIEFYNKELPSGFERDFELDTSSDDYNSKKPFKTKATRTWYIQTDSDGYALFDNDWIVTKGTYTSGELYTRYDEALEKDVPIIPYGTIMVSEVKSPDPTKYQVSTTAYYRTVDEEGIGNISTMELDIPEPRTPELDTVAVDSKTKSHSAVISKSTSITDTITYVGLHPTKTYTMKGWVVEKSTGTIYSGVSTKTFTPDNSGAGTVSLTHTFASDGSVAGKATLAGKSVVAFAQVIDDTGAVVAEHKDLNDADQTVSFIAKGEITTKADFEILYGESVKYNHPNSIDRSHSFLYDNVYGYGLEEGTYYLYTMVLEVKNGVLVKENGKIARPVFWNDNIGGVTYNQPYHSCTVVTNSSGAFTEEIEIEFNGDFSNTDGKSYVVYEFLSKNNLADKLSNTDYNAVFNYFMSVKDDSKIMAANHTDSKDSNQTINFKSPKITTEAYPYSDKNRDSAYISGSKNETTIIESVKMENLNKGINYCLKPYVYVVENGKRVLLDESIAQKVKVYNGSSLISKNSNGTPFILNSICEGEDYDYSDTADRTGAFTFSAVSETQTLSLKFDFSECKDYLKGKTVTFGEMLITEGRTDYYNIAEHNTSYKNATTIDANQTVNFIEAKVSTKAISDNTGTSYAYALGDSISITDTVKMTGLIPGKSYNLSGYLVDETGKAIPGSTKSGYFTAKAETQTMDRVLTLKNPSNFVGKKVVAYENLSFGSYTIASHMDLGDDKQTIYVLDPTIDTTASTSNSRENHSSTHRGTSVTVYDTVSLTGLIVGKQYTIQGQVISKSESLEGYLEPVELTSASCSGATVSLSDDKKTVSVLFTATSESQDIKISYKIDSGKGTVSYVVVEDLIYEGTTIASHKDYDDVDQTVEFIGVGKLIVNKLDSYNGNKLGGVKFNLYSVDDKGTKETEDDVETLIENQFFVTGNYSTGSYYYSDTPKDSYYTDVSSKVKYDNSGVATPDDQIGILTINDLPQGKYRLVEIASLSGYDIDIQDGVTFEVKGGKTTDFDVTNTPIKVNASFIKTDDNTVESEIKPISGAGFKIYSDSSCTTEAKDFYKNDIPEVFSNESGIITFPDLAYSKTKNTYYYIKETTTPEGYVPLDYKIRLVVDKNGNTSYYKISKSGSLTIATFIKDTYNLYIDEDHHYFSSFTRIINKRGSVELNKINETNQPLDGSKWELYKVDKVKDATTGKETTKNTLVVLDLTDEDGVYRCNDSAEGETVLSTNDLGKLKVENLPLGDYYFQEVKAPEKNIYDSKGLLVDVLSYMPYGDKIYFSLTAEKPDLTSETSDTEPNGDSIVVKNNLSLLPKTGGFGDGLVYIAGISFLLIASIIFALCGVRLKKKYKNF